MRLILMGTPEFAIPTLTALHRAGHTIAAAVCQPDRPKGRGGQLAAPPIKILAEQMEIPVLQPTKMKDPALHERLREFKPDYIMVVAYGRILPPAVLEIPPRGCINLHASLLPKYRGAAPIQWAVINGETETGVTTIRMDPGMDTGDILLQETTPILPEDTAGSLAGRLAQQGGDLMVRTLEGIQSGRVFPVPQDHERATMAPILEKEAGEIDWNQTGAAIRNRIRGLDPWPGAYTFLNNERLRIWKSAVTSEAAGGSPGRVVRAGKDILLVATTDVLLALQEVQPANGRRMAIREFLAGHSIEEDTVLGH